MIVLLLLSLISSIILAAVLLSTLAKASSRTTIGELTRSALPSAVLCLCPPLNVIPLSPTIVLNVRTQESFLDFANSNQFDLDQKLSKLV